MDTSSNLLFWPLCLQVFFGWLAMFGNCIKDYHSSSWKEEMPDLDRTKMEWKIATDNTTYRTGKYKSLKWHFQTSIYQWTKTVNPKLAKTKCLRTNIPEESFRVILQITYALPEVHSKSKHGFQDYSISR